MTALRVGSEYEAIREQNKEIFQKHSAIIEKITDLFIRIKNTNQAEEVSTVLFTIRKLKEKTNQGKVSEKEVFDYILDWKKDWNTDEKKHEPDI